MEGTLTRRVREIPRASRDCGVAGVAVARSLGPRAMMRPIDAVRSWCGARPARPRRRVLGRARGCPRAGPPRRRRWRRWGEHAERGRSLELGRAGARRPPCPRCSSSRSARPRAWRPRRIDIAIAEARIAQTYARDDWQILRQGPVLELRGLLQRVHDRPQHVDRAVARRLARAADRRHDHAPRRQPVRAHHVAARWQRADQLVRRCVGDVRAAAAARARALALRGQRAAGHAVPRRGRARPPARGDPDGADRGLGVLGPRARRAPGRDHPGEPRRSRASGCGSR